MEEQLISFEVARLAKEKGFEFESILDNPDEYGNSRHSYVKRRSNNEYVAISHYYLDTNHNCQQYDYSNDVSISAPTQSLLAKWLREVYNIHVHITRLYKYQPEPYKFLGYCGYIDDGKEEDLEINQFFMRQTYDNYEDCLEKLLFEALKLIP